MQVLTIIPGEQRSTPMNRLAAIRYRAAGSAWGMS